MENNRGSFSGNIGFILAAAGSAVGLGNIWKFPYLTGNNGGGIFILIYLILIATLGIPIILGETIMGRYAQGDAMISYRKIAQECKSKSPKAWSMVGFMGILCGFVILSYYSVVGGWVIEYIVNFITKPIESLNMDTFVGTISSPITPIIYTAIFSLVGIFIVVRGIEGGIEKANKVMMPALFIILIIVVIRSITLPGAVDGLKFMWVPNMEAVEAAGGLGKVALAAMGQVFFSLSIGMGCMITYGSYLKKDTNVIKNSIVVGCMDTSVALLAGMAVLPAVFAFGMEPGQGPGLLFGTIPQVFANFGGIVGPIFGILFFVLVLFAALTSSISLLEVVACYMVDTYKWARKKAVWLMGGIIFIISMVCSLANGPLAGVTIAGLNIFDALSWLSDKILLPWGGLLMCIFIGYVWKPERAKMEATNGGKITWRWYVLWKWLMMVILPILIFIVFLSGIGLF